MVEVTPDMMKPAMLVISAIVCMIIVYEGCKAFFRGDNEK